MSHKGDPPTAPSRTGAKRRSGTCAVTTTLTGPGTRPGRRGDKLISGEKGTCFNTDPIHFLSAFTGVFHVNQRETCSAPKAFQFSRESR